MWGCSDISKCQYISKAHEQFLIAFIMQEEHISDLYYYMCLNTNDIYLYH